MPVVAVKPPVGDAVVEHPGDDVDAARAPGDGAGARGHGRTAEALPGTPAVAVEVAVLEDVVGAPREDVQAARAPGGDVGVGGDLTAHVFEVPVGAVKPPVQEVFARVAADDVDAARAPGDGADPRVKGAAEALPRRPAIAVEVAVLESVVRAPGERVQSPGPPGGDVGIGLDVAAEVVLVPGGRRWRWRGRSDRKERRLLGDCSRSAGPRRLQSWPPVGANAKVPDFFTFSG